MGQPTFYGEKSCITALMEKGLTLEEAEHFSNNSCMGISIPGNEFNSMWGCVFSVSSALETAMNCGKILNSEEILVPDITVPHNIDELFKNFEKCAKYLLGICVRSYEKAIADGASKEELTELLSGFLMKTNEICGRGTHNYKPKPVLCQSSKQYVNIGGENPNEFSKLVLKSAVMNNMAQPQITVLLKPEANEEFTKEVFSAMSKLVDKLHIYNYDLIVNALIKKGILPEDAKKFTFSACCTFDLNYYAYRLEYYTPTLQIFLDVINKREYSDIETLIKDLTAALKRIFKGI